MNQQFQTQFLLEDTDVDTEALREKMAVYLVKYCGASEDTADMLSKAAADRLIDFEKAIAICKATTGLDEEGSVSGGAGAFLPSLHASPKKYKGPELEEDAPMLAHGKADISTYTNDKFTKVPKGHAKLKSIQIKDLWAEEAVDEVWNYNTGGVKAWDYEKILPEDMEAALKKIVSNPKVTEKDLVGIRNRAQQLYGKGLTRDELNFYKNTSLEDFKEMFLESTSNLDETILKATKEKLDSILQIIKEKSPKLYDYILDLITDVYPHDDEVEALVSKSGLQENYNRFKRETKMRPKQEQYHEAIKVVNKKLDEVNRILEFTTRMKNELAEGEEILEVKARTSQAMDKIKTKIAEAYKKLKNLN